jgi:TetR/AcrR family transcriptional regulator
MARTVRDAAKTRAKILKHASVEYAAKGFDGARVDGIARRSRVNKNMIYHYFGSKEGLFLAVLEDVYAAIRARQSDFVLRDHEPVEGMRELVRFTFMAFIEHPEIIGLLNSENLHKGRHLRRSKHIQELYDPLLDTIRTLLDRGRAEGVFRDGIDPVQLYISIAALGYHYLSNHYTLEVIFGIDLVSAERIAARADHVVDMVLSYCQVPAARAAARKEAPPAVRRRRAVAGPTLVLD